MLGETAGPRHCGGDVPLCPLEDTGLVTPLGLRPSPATKEFSIMLKREEAPVGTCFSWGQQDQLGMVTTLAWWYLGSGQ